VKSPCHRLWQVDYTRKAEEMRREILGNANQNKPTRRAGYKVMYTPPTSPPNPLARKHSELKEPGEMLNKTRTLTIAR